MAPPPLVCCLRLLLCRRRILKSVAGSGCGGAPAWDGFSTLAFAVLAAFHALGLFSVGLLMGEGRLTCVLLAAVTLLLLRAALSAVLQARKLAQASQQDQRHDRAASPSDSVNGSHTATQPLQDGQQHLQLVFPAAQYWGSWRPASRAVRAAASVLVCNVSLQLLGLIDRSGQDPHDKTQPSSELLVGPDAAWQKAALLAFTVGPLAMMWLGFRAASKTLGDWTASAPVLQPEASLRTDAHHTKRLASRDCSSATARCWRAVCGVQFFCLAVFWVAQLFGRSNATVCELAAALWATCRQGPLACVAPVFSAVAESLGKDVLQACKQVLLSSGLCVLPLRLLLPRVIYVAALAVLVAAVLIALWRAWLLAFRNMASGKPVQGPARLAEAASGLAVAELLWLCAVLAAPLVMVLGFKGPATMLCALLQAVGLCVLLQLNRAATLFVQSRSAPSSGDAVGTAGGSQQVASSVGPRDDGCCSVVGAGAWGLMALQLFFCSGHFCEFSGLQYASAFIGFDDMVWYSSGSLLLLNTCGFLFLAPLSLPVFVTASTAMPASGTKGCCGGVSGSRRTRGWAVRQQVGCGLWVTNSMRFAALAVSLISAAVQQQHILLWAIFAPKLVFELWFMVVTAVGQLLVAWLLPHT